MVQTLTAVPLALSLVIFELLAVVDRALAHPGAEHRAHRNLELLVRVLRKRLAGVALDDLQEFAGQLLQVLGGQVQVQARAVFALERRHLFVEMLVLDAERDLAEQLDEAAVGVVGKALIAWSA